jgi:hypothetical protein
MNDSSEQQPAGSNERLPEEGVSDTAVGDAELPPVEEEAWQGEPPRPPAGERAQQSHADQAE